VVGKLEMKFSFINASPNEDLGEREGRKAIASFPPLGILYLATVLKERGVEVSVLDQPAKGFTIEETVKWIEKEAPDILGFSTFASSGRTAALISNEVKKKNPNIIIVFGNYYATFNSERVLRKYPSVDIIVRGEGENTVIDLVNCLKNKGKLKDVLGITFRNNNSIISTLDRPLIGDLNCLPFPDRKLIDMEYHSVIAGANVAPKKFTSIVSSRGCFYRCRFCSCRQFARGRWRPRSIKNTMEELHFLASEGYKQFIFVDDSFTLNQKRVIKLSKRMRKEKIDMEWICEGRVDNCSFEMLREIARVGCKLIYFGIESANQRILDYYNKQTTPQQSRTAVKTGRKAGIDVIIGSFIVGGPDETRDEIQNTIEFAERIPIDLPQFSILGVYPGTDIWNEFEMKGLLKGGEYWETGIAVSEICPSAVPLHEIRQMIHDGFYDFVRRPSFILKQFVRTLKSQYRMSVMMNNLSRLGSIRENIRSIT
jgi:anaerobic magnesium-protoporphyrin IX monomethyl ester cyclase